MLKVLRDNLKYLSWILWGVILVFIFFVFAEWGGAGQRLQGNQQVAVQVGNQEISYRELDRAHRNLRDSYARLYGGQIPAELSEQLQLPLQAVRQLVRQRLMVQEALDAGLQVSDRELSEEMLELPVFQDASGEFIGAERYEQAVRSLGYSNPSSFEEALRQDLLVEKLRSLFEDTVAVNDDEVEKAYREQNETAKIDYLFLPTDQATAEIEVSDAEVEAYFAAHTEDFRLPEKRIVRYLLVDPAELQSNLAIGDAEVEAYFQDNSDDYSREERVRARQILLRTDEGRDEAEAQAMLESARQRIESGEDFASIAAEISEDPTSATNGGDLGYFGRGEILPEVENVTFASELGQVVGPIRTSFGLHLIEVMDRQEGGLPPFEEVKEQVRGRMLRERATQLTAEKAVAIAAKVEGGDVAAATWPQLAQAEAGVAFFESAPFAANEPIPGIGFSPQFSAAAFDLEAGTPSEPVNMGSTWAVLDLVRVEEPRLPELNEVVADVRAATQQDKAREQNENRLASAREAIESGRTLERAASGLGVEVVSTETFNKRGAVGDLGAASELREAALQAAEGDLIGPLSVPGGVALARVAERVEFDAAQFATARDSTEQGLRQQEAGRLLESLLQRREEAAKIEYNPDLVARLDGLS